MTGTLYRSRSDRMFLGVCGGLAAHFGIDATAVRVLAVLLAWVSFGAAVIAYFVIALFVPEEPAGAEPTVPYARPRDAAVPGRDTTMADETTGATPPQPGEPTPPEGVVAPPPSAPGQTTAPGPATPPPVPPVQPPTYYPPSAPPQAPRPGWEHEHHHHRNRGGLTGGIILIVLGLLFLAQQFVPGLDLFRLWPLVLIAIGLSIIFRRR
jgi:phage shock protein C